MSYLTVDDEEHIVQLSLLNDWDLDAAILNCQTYLKLIVQIKPADESKQVFKNKKDNLSEPHQCSCSPD